MLKSLFKSVKKRISPSEKHQSLTPDPHQASNEKEEERLSKIRGLKISSTTHDKNRPTLLVVSHMANKTGAPILALNIAEYMRRYFNIIMFFQSDGPLFDEARHIGAEAVAPARDKQVAADYAVQTLLDKYSVDYAIVNSIESVYSLPPLWRANIPTLCLVHEFAAYVQQNKFWEALSQSSRLIFSNRLIQENAIAANELVERFESSILPQGRCTPTFEALPLEDKDKRYLRLLAQRKKDGKKIVLAAGTMELRKGVDLFIACIRKLEDLDSSNQYEYVWVGNNVNVEWYYSLCLKEQVARCGLDGRILFVGETNCINEYYALMDVMLLTSRLDPLPNVAIDALSTGKPVLCFDRATGIAPILAEHGLEKTCVAEYMNTEQMAQQCHALLQSPETLEFVSKRSAVIAKEVFDFQKYGEKLRHYLTEAKAGTEMLLEDVATIQSSNALDKTYCNYDSKNEAEIKTYITSWKYGFGACKPFPGFHPGIYAETNGMAFSKGDPLAHFIRSGRPQGPWLYPVKIFDSRLDVSPSSVKVALHLHVYYTDVLGEILESLAVNSTRPDLFISVPSPEVKAETIKQLSRFGLSAHTVTIVPNRGRDLGPLFTEFGEQLVRDYEIIGHLHTKKSFDVKNEVAISLWRRFLCTHLLGGNNAGAVMDHILNLMSKNPGIGLVFADDVNQVGWCKNYKYAEELLAHFPELELPKHFNFPVGSSCWMRKEVLKSFVDAGWKWEDYPEEPLPYDGTMLHAIERLLGLMPEYVGLSKLGIRVVGCNRYSDEKSVFTLRSHNENNVTSGSETLPNFRKLQRSYLRYWILSNVTFGFIRRHYRQKRDKTKQMIAEAKKYIS